MPDPLQDGSRSLPSSDERFKKKRKHVMIEDLHVCNVAILLIFEIYRQEVYVERIDVGASSSGQHLLEGAIAIAVTFERKDLLSRRGGGEKGGMNSPMLVWNGWGVCTLPWLSISALRWEVLFPGAAVASIITLFGCASGASTTAGKHDALSWRMRRPSEYSGISVRRDCGGNNRRFSTCASRAKFLRREGLGQAFVDKKKLRSTRT